MPDLYARVILPLPLHDTYTYRIPPKWEALLKPGQRVVVQFGSKKIYSALVYSVTPEAPQKHQVKEILEVLDNEPVVLPQNFSLWKWMAEYYCCTLGDVFKAALPPGLKLESKSKIILDSGWNEHEISESEHSIITAIQKDVSSLDVLQKKLGGQFSYPSLKSLLERNIIHLEEKIYTKYKPQSKDVVKLNARITDETVLKDTINSLAGAKKQQALLLRFCEDAHIFQPGQKSYLSKKTLLNENGFTSAVLNGLVAKNILSVSQIEVSRLAKHQARQVDLNLLNQYQQKALEEVKACFDKKQVTLIHGITASGKTEIYIHLIEEVLKKGMQALYLLPEIALTTQIVERLKDVFGPKVGIYHSRLNNHERVEIWNKVLLFQTRRKKGTRLFLAPARLCLCRFRGLV
jgi:primosomal protein N' (replication factor Y) (superfamily II helicase)